MARTEHYYTKFESGRFYHVYNRAVGGENLFEEESNFQFFLKRFRFYLNDYVETWSYCLLPNHFHFLVRVRDLTTFKKSSSQTDHEMVSDRFRKLFQSYSMAFNKYHDRRGTLFQRPFKRALVDSDNYLTSLVVYIHKNPQQHGLFKDFKNWPYSSFDFDSKKNLWLSKQAILDWFGNKKSYLQAHGENENQPMLKLRMDGE